jgi:Ca2+-transporting ATPase
VGLSGREAAARLQEYGRNEVRTGGRTSLPVRVLVQLRDPLILVLLAAAVLTSWTGDIKDTAVIAIVVLANTAVGVAQEVRADRAIAALRKLAAPCARVTRDGGELQVPATEVVPGDLVQLQAGDIVPADGSLCDAKALQLDESALTGESVPVDKDGAGVVFAGTVVTRGRGAAVITATGPSSTLGKIAKLLAAGGPALTPLQRRLAGLGRSLAAVAVVLCSLFLALGLARGEPVEITLVAAASLVVAAVPESLPAVATLALALGAHRMAARNAIVRRLPAVETLGSVDLLATDKTGTLTEGRMAVERIWIPETGEIAPPYGRATGALAELITAVVLNNDTVMNAADHTLLGDPTEIGLLSMAAAASVEPQNTRAAAPRVAEFPFDAARRRMTTVHATAGGLLVLCKGAPDSVLDGVVSEPTMRLGDAHAAARRLSESGLRVLAVGSALRTTVPADAAEAENGLWLLGLVGLADPPRAAAAEAVRACLAAGIRTVLVTGDHPATARAIATRVGIESGPAAVAVTGDELEAGAVPNPERVSVYARTSPRQKLDLIDTWQRQGRVVAMTGDGVNDGPALRKADIGIAMGRRGTEVAKQAADLVLADDDLSTLVIAVREGRRVYANVRRFLRYAMAGGTAEILVMLLGPFVGIPLPLLPGQILWVNLMTHGLPGVAFGAEPAEPGALERPPRAATERILADGLWQRILRLGAVIGAVTLGAAVWADSAGYPVQTTAFLTLGLMQLGSALALRVRLPEHRVGNPFLLVAVAVAIALQLGAVYAPPAQDLLGTRPLTGVGLAVPLAASLCGYLTVRIEDSWTTRRARARAVKPV